MRRLALASLLALAACAQRGRPDDDARLIHEPPPAEPQIEAAKPDDAPPEPPRRRQGVIARRALLEVLDAAPGRFLQRVTSEPSLRGGRFHGWQLVSFFSGDPRFVTVDLRPGDVVTRVNGSSLERPEQLMKVWEALRTSRELVVEVERGGQPHTLRYAIAD